MMLADKNYMNVEMIEMLYMGQFLYWFMIICAIAAAIKGLYILCAKKAIYPGNIFKEIKVTNVKKYNMLNGILLIGLGIVFAAAASMFRYGSFSTLSVLLSGGIFITVTKLEKRIENNYLESKYTSTFN
ncbi:MAG: hypothetical protein ACRC3H_01905 [Lachnospiraceae bacterium]